MTECSRTLRNLQDYYWHGPPLRLSGVGTHHHWHRPGTAMSGLTYQCVRLRYGHSESVLPQNFSLLDSHASSLRPDSAGERRQVRFAPCELPSGRVVRRDRRGAVERSSSSSSSSSWSLERRKAVSLQAQAREAKRLKIMQASTRFGLARTKCKVQSAKYIIVFGRIDDCGIRKQSAIVGHSLARARAWAWVQTSVHEWPIEAS